MALYFSFRLLIRYRCLVVTSTNLDLKSGFHPSLACIICSHQTLHLVHGQRYILWGGHHQQDDYFSKFLHKFSKCLLLTRESDITNRGLDIKFDLPNKIYYILNTKKTTSLTLFFRSLVCGLSCKIILYLTEEDIVNQNIKNFPHQVCLLMLSMRI